MKNKLAWLLLLLLPFLLMGAAVIGYQDWQLRASAPANPASGFFRVWADNTGQYFKCLTSSGSACYFDPRATSSTPGIVQTDGSTISNAAGTISCTTATTSQLGCVKPDGSTITISGGVISASGGGGGGSTNTPYGTPVAASSTIPYNGLTLWFSADCITLSSAGACSTPSNGASVDLWSDRSGNYFQMSTTTTACSFATNQINGEPAVSFNGSCGKYTLYPFNAAGYTTAWRDVLTIFAVAKAAATGNYYAILGGGIEYRINASKQQEILNEGVASLGTGTAATDTSWHQMGIQCATSTLIASSVQPTLRLDRSADSTVSGANCSSWSGNSYVTDLVSLGYASRINGDVFSGEIAEVIVYNRYLSSAEVTNVESYLHGKYGL